MTCTITTNHWRSVCALVVFLLFIPNPGSADPALGLFQLLQPGLGAPLGLSDQPFARPTRDQTGWWSGGPVAAERSAELQGAFIQPIGPRLTDNQGEITSRNGQASLSWPTSVGSSRISGKALLRHDDQRLIVETGGDQFYLTGQGMSGAVWVRWADLLPGLTAQVSLPVHDDDLQSRHQPLGVGVRYSVPEKFWFQAHHRNMAWDYRLDFDVEDEQVITALNLQQDSWTLDTAFKVGSSLLVEASFVDRYLSPLRSPSAELQYHLEPAGHQGCLSGGVRYGDEDRSQFLVRGSWQTHDWSGVGYSDGQRFLQLSYLEGDLATISFGYQRKMNGTSLLRLDVSGFRLRGKGRAKIESWPFTDSLVDLLGSTMTFKEEHRVEWTRLHAGWEHESARGAWGASLAWYNIFPEMDVTHWQSGFLGFGRTNITNLALAAEHIQLGGVSVGKKWRLGSWQIDLQAFQIVYANVTNQADEDPGVPSQPDPPGGTVGDDEPTGWFGGTLAHVAAKYFF